MCYLSIMAKASVTAETKNKHLSVWVSDDQKDMITRAAAAEDEDKPGRWLRKLGLKRAREVLGEAPVEKKGGRR